MKLAASWPVILPLQNMDHITQVR